jgi:membrane-associated phospholipid phosphatase
MVPGMRILIVLAILSSTASAEPAGRRRDRVVRTSVTAVGAAFFVVTETALKGYLAPSECRFCGPNPTDATVRNALVWRHPGVASTLSDIEGFGVAPLFAIAASAHDVLGSGAGAVFDEVLPVVESGVIAGDLAQVVKFSVGRQRPYAHFNPSGAPDIDDNLSFFSGHSALAFSLATSAGMMAHRRHSRLEPYVWGAGLSLAASTAYLRIAADKHYLTDVIVGAGVGVAVGFAVAGSTVPDRRIMVVSTGNGLGVVGRF